MANPTNDTMTHRDSAFAVAVVVIWGVNFVVIRVGLDSYPPLLMATLRFALVAGIGVWIVPRPAVSWSRLIAVGLTFGVGQFGFIFVAIDRGMSAGLAAVVLQAQAAFTLLFAVPVFRERISSRQLVGILVSTAGLVLLAFDVGDGVDLDGFVLTLFGAAAFGAGNIAIKGARTSDGLALIVWASLIPPIPLLVLSVWLEGPDRIGDAMSHFDVGGVGALLYLAVMATYVGFGTWSSLLSKYSASIVAPFTLIVPPIGLATAWLFLGERPPVLALAAATVIVAGVAIPLLAVWDLAPVESSD